MGKHRARLDAYKPVGRAYLTERLARQREIAQRWLEKRADQKFHEQHPNVVRLKRRR